MRKWLGILILFFAGVANGASFDCGKASSDVEHMICSDAGLSRLDEELANAYQTTLNALKNVEKDHSRIQKQRSRLQEEQRLWIKRRDACSTKDNCLYVAYSQRLQQLHTLMFIEKVSGFYECRVGFSAIEPDNPTGTGHAQVSFRIKDGFLSDFEARTVNDCDECRLGYVNECWRTIGDFYNVSDNTLVLFQNEQSFADESLGCKVHLEDLGDKFEAYSSDCVSVCMQFDVEISKTSKDCYHQ